MNGHRALRNLSEQNPAYRSTLPSIPCRQYVHMKTSSLFSGFTHIGPLRLPVNNSEECVSFYLDHPHVVPLASSDRKRKKIGVQIEKAFDVNWQGFEKEDFPFLFDERIGMFSSLLIPFASPSSFLERFSTAEITTAYANVIKWTISFVETKYVSPLFIETSSSENVDLHEIYSFLYVFASELEIPMGIVNKEHSCNLPADFYLFSNADNTGSIQSPLPLPSLSVPWMSDSEIETTFLRKAYQESGVVAS